jgi:hypothetical protein
MIRNTLLAVTLFLSACGLEAAVPAVGDEPQPLTTQLPDEAAVERPRLQALTPRLRAEHLTPVMDVVSVHSLALADGTQVRYLLGMLGCGILVAAQGSATVQGGAFEIPYDPALAEFGQLSLFLQFDTLGTGVCDPETSQVYEVPATLPGAVDLSVLPEQSFIGCWLFDSAQG